MPCIRVHMTCKFPRLASIWLLLVWAIGGSMEIHAQSQDDPARIVQAQESEGAALAEAWLASSDPRARAWGAYLVLRDRQSQLIPRLATLLEAYPVKVTVRNGRDRDEHNAMLSVLDAVIQLNDVISPEAAAKLYPEFPAPSLILLSRSGPASDGYLLDIFGKEDKATGAWLAAGNLLMNGKSPGFTASVLGNLKVDDRVRVVDDRSAADRGVGSGGSCSSGLPSTKTGWPLVGNYYISRHGMLLADGADPSFYFRRVGGPDANAQSGDYQCEFIFLQSKRDTFRERFLAKLVGESPDNPSVRSQVSETIAWKSDAQYLNDLRSVVRRQQDLFEKLRMKLVASGLLTPEESATVKPSLEIRVLDVRSKRPSNLPPLQQTDSNVQIVN
jgi:hypothetical protein